jgi:cobalt/nickel transport system permease protein
MSLLRGPGQRDARAAIITTLCVALAIALLPAGSYLAYAVVWLGVATAAALSGIAPLTLARRGAIALPFVLAALPLLFTRSDELLWNGTVGSASISISGAGLRIVLTAAAKAWISVQLAILLVRQHPIESIVGSLRALRLPDALATGAGLTVRYLDLLRGEASRMLRARSARSASPLGTTRERIGGTIPWRARVTGNLAGALFLRAYARAARVEEAANARGATGSLSLGALRERDPHVAAKSGLAVALFALITVAGAVLPRM